MNSPPEPGSPSLSTPSSSSPPPEEYFTQEAAKTTDLLNMVTNGLNLPSSSKRRPTFGFPSARDSKSRRREGPQRGGGSAATWDKDGGGGGSSSRKEDMIDNSAVDFLRKEIGDPFLE